ncbi:MAG: HEPN domain-containing protein [Lautropia sp.]|nr:HEPN domain-containing protein [Lautropia sp.]
MLKADRACASARVLLDLGDVDGASDRAYYAMFDAARAALLASDETLSEDPGRSHGGLIGAFGQKLVRQGLVSKDMGRLLNRAHEIRLIAAYAGVSVEQADASALVKEAECFVAVMRDTFMQKPADSTDPSA